MCGKRFALLLVVFSLLSSLTLSAETCLTDEEMEELTAIFSRLQTISTEQEARLTLLQGQLEIAETSLQASTTEIANLRASLNERDKYWQTLMREQKRKAVTAGAIVGLSALIVGLVTGLLIHL